MTDSVASSYSVSSVSQFGEAFRGSPLTQASSVVTNTINSQQGSLYGTASSTLGGPGGACPAFAAPSSPVAWDADGAQSQALVSPVHLCGKKKGGLLSGLKKMFQPHKGDGRAATVEGQRNGVRPDLDISVSGTDGSSFLDPSVGKVDRSLKAPGTSLKVHVGGSSRDLTLAALITSPVRAPIAPNSPAPLNSPMPSMRLDQLCPSSVSSQDVILDAATGTYSISGGDSSHNPQQPHPLHHQRLFPNFHKNSSSRPSGSPSSLSSTSSAPIPHLQHGQLLSSVSSHLPAATRLQASPASISQNAFQKSMSTALAHANSGGFCGIPGASCHPYSSASPTPPRSDVGSGGDADGRTSNSSSASRVPPALPLLTSPRGNAQPEYQAPSVSSPGRLRTGSQTPPLREPVPEEPSGRDSDDKDEDESYDGYDGPGSVLLGLNPAVPAGMRRRKWCLDDYQVVKRMYKGSTSAVYRAICTRSGIPVALKVYFLSRVPINVVHMIRREIELHVPLVHRNIVMLYSAFQDEKHIVLVEEYAARGDLFGIHRSMNCRLTETQTSELILAPFLDALSYLHARGIMHRDIKPENILFTQDWMLKIADFGVSINVHDERAVTRTGTADYMAPEVERCPLKHAPEDNKDNPNLAYTTAIDIWSVGVLAYEMLVGFPPFVSNGAEESNGASRPGVAAFMAEQATRKTLRFPASVSSAAKDFIMTALNENPGDRPTAQQLLKHPWLFRVVRQRTNVTATSRFSNPNMVLGSH